MQTEFLQQSACAFNYDVKRWQLVMAKTFSDFDRDTQSESITGSQDNLSLLILNSFNQCSIIFSGAMTIYDALLF